MPIRIGIAGWSIPRQHAEVFPAEGSHLARYAQVFSCVEINSSFYRPHRPATYQRWARATPEYFRFSVKAPKAITHQSALAPTRVQLEDFLDEARHLADRLGPILFQFPPRQNFDATQVRAFFALFRDLYPDGDAVVEPRHAEWFGPEADEILEQFQLLRVFADPRPTPSAKIPFRYGNLVYHRLHGSPRIYYSSYAAEYLETLAATLAAYPPATEVWCIFDNTALGAAIENALALIQSIQRIGQPE